MWENISLLRLFTCLLMTSLMLKCCPLLLLPLPPALIIILIRYPWYYLFLSWGLLLIFLLPPFPFLHLSVLLHPDQCPLSVCIHIQSDHCLLFFCIKVKQKSLRVNQFTSVPAYVVIISHHHSKRLTHTQLISFLVPISPFTCNCHQRDGRSIWGLLLLLLALSLWGLP